MLYGSGVLAATLHARFGRTGLQHWACLLRAAQGMRGLSAAARLQIGCAAARMLAAPAALLCAQHQPPQRRQVADLHGMRFPSDRAVLFAGQLCVVREQGTACISVQSQHAV